MALGQSAPAIFVAGTVNAADYSRTFAPGAIVSIFGTSLAASTQAAPQIPLLGTLGGTSVLVAGVPAPLLYVSPAQINLQLQYGLSGNITVQVKTASGVSNTDTIFVGTRAPKIFTVDFSGQNGGIVTTTSNALLTAATPDAPAENVSIYLNSVGATTGSPVAGLAAPANATVSDTVTASIGGVAATVNAAVLQPGSVGLYRVDIQSPFVVLTGPVSVAVTIGGVTTQANVNMQYRQLGFYYALLGGVFPNSQTRNGVSGSNSSLALRNADSGTWGTTGFNAWTNTTPNGANYSTAAGLALTLVNTNPNGSISYVYDNNGIETGLNGGFYSNLGGSSTDASRPGLSDFYSSSNYFPLVFAGYFKLTASTTFTQIIGYFDHDASSINASLPFDQTNPYVKYRMNFWSMTSGGLPKETGSFVGDVFSSDTTAGTFAYSITSTPMVSQNPAKNATRYLWRLSYTLASPMTLPAGEYWFDHDLFVRPAPAASSLSDAPVVTAEELQSMIRRAQDSKTPRGPSKFTLLGTEITGGDGWNLPSTVIVRPSSPVLTPGDRFQEQ